MFKKLISNLPFNPSLVSQVSFYAKRVHEEASVRRMGFGLIALAMFIQMFAVIAPPEKSLAASDNHIINGLRTRTDILSAWDRKGSDIPSIYGKFGLTRADIEKLPLNPNTTIRSDSSDWWTIGRNSLSNYGNVKDQYKVSEIALNTGPVTVYMRQLRAWDIVNKYNTYRAFTGKKADGTQFWILVDCGNYTQIGKYAPKKPTLDIRKSVVGTNTAMKPGDTFTYRIEYRNRTQDSLAENAMLHDAFDFSSFDIVNPTNLTLVDNRLRQGVGSLSYSSNYKVLDITVRLKNPFPNYGGKVCNTAKISSTNADDALSGPACVTVTTPCPYNPAIDINNPNCKPPVPPKNPCKYNPDVKEDDATCKPAVLYCSLVDTYLDKTKREATFKTTVTSTNEKLTQVHSYTYDFGDGSKAVTVDSKAYTNTTKHIYAAGAYTAKVTISGSITGVDGKQQVSCSSPIEFDGDKPFGEIKTVKNITQKLEGDKAVGAKVNAGDVLEYALVTSNTQDFERKNYVVVDYVGDILDYATVDTAFLKTQGGTFDEATKKISFTLASVAAKSDVSKLFRVTLKNPIPATNKPSSVSGTYDCKIANKYGNELTMNVSCPVIKGVENLPNTGPGTSLIIGFTITTIVGYFFARARLMSKELAIIRSEYAPTGGF